MRKPGLGTHAMLITFLGIKWCYDQKSIIQPQLTCLPKCIMHSLRLGEKRLASNLRLLSDI